jgi:hypothetical protein
MKSKSDLEHGNSNGYSPLGQRDVGEGLKGGFTSALMDVC